MCAPWAASSRLERGVRVRAPAGSVDLRGGVNWLEVRKEGMPPPERLWRLPFFAPTGLRL